MQDRNSHSHVYVAKYNHLLLVSIVLSFQSYQWRKKKKKLNFLDGSLLFIHKYLSSVVDFIFFKPYPYNITQNMELAKTGLSCHPYLRLVFCITKNRVWLSTKLTQCVITFIFPLFFVNDNDACFWQQNNQSIRNLVAWLKWR